ncbi:kinesin-like protein [Kipferlia bialata]|uniref:Kinesin-like protein n=1 Tax=Kipferlia bialata TaxID=797122 RepID=A0A9K3CQZ6_9EUKA|nr:kinesin-like protein [Kipferlia bialata]|eukprot:g2549.t1
MPQATRPVRGKASAGGRGMARSGSVKRLARSNSSSRLRPGQKGGPKGKAKPKARAGGQGAENVRVAVRVRPPNESERGQPMCVTTEEGAPVIEVDTEGTVPPKAGPKGRTPNSGAAKSPIQRYTFDHVFPPGSGNDELYSALGPSLLDSTLSGYHSTLFAYGQTGSGKTYSVSGDHVSPGIIPRLNTELFERMDTMKDEKHEFLVTLSYLELYKDSLRDLLSPSSNTPLEIREHPKLGIFVNGLTELVVESASDVMSLAQQAAQLRQVGSTDMNAQSSRSHTVFSLKVQQRQTETVKDTETVSTLVSKLSLVDLAGSESVKKTGAAGDRFQEGVAINSALLALGNVIHALSEQARSKSRGRGPSQAAFIPYRNSKLTRLLQESLGGNARTTMLATVSPSRVQCQETLGTLGFARRAKIITNSVKKNEDESATVIASLREEIETLRAQLQGGAGQGQGEMDTSHAERMQRYMVALEHAKRQSWRQRQKQAASDRAERLAALTEAGLYDTVVTGIRDAAEIAAKDIAALTSELDRLKHTLSEARQAQADCERNLKEAQEGTGMGIKEATAALKKAKAKSAKAKAAVTDIAQRIRARRADKNAAGAFMKHDQEYRETVAQRERETVQKEHEQALREEEASLMQQDRPDVVSVAMYTTQELRHLQVNAQCRTLRHACKEREREVERLRDLVAKAEELVALRRRQIPLMEAAGARQGREERREELEREKERMRVAEAELQEEKERNASLASALREIGQEPQEGAEAAAIR